MESDLNRPEVEQTGSQYFAHVYRTDDEGKGNRVVIEVETTDPTTFAEGIRKTLYTYIGSVLLRDRTQAVQLSSLGLGPNKQDARWAQPVEAMARIMPHVADVLSRLEQRGIGIVPLTYELTVRGDPALVVSVLREISASPLQQRDP